MEAKAKEEAERQRVVEEEERKRRTMEYLQRLWDEVLEEEAAYYFFNNFLLHSRSLVCAGYITLKQRCVPHTNTNTLAMISTYGGVLSTIEKALRELVEEYRGVGKSLWDLVEGQERNTAQLERIGAAMERRWGLEGESRKEENRDEEEGSEDGSGESQEGGTPSSTSC